MNTPRENPVVRYKNFIVGFIFGFGITLAGLTVEDVLHDISVLEALSEYHHFFSPLIVGLIFGFLSYTIGIRNNQRIKSLKDTLAIHEKYKKMTSNISDVIGIIDEKGIIVYKSPNIKTQFGWSPDELIGKEAWVTVHPDDTERIQKEFISLLGTENSTTEVEYRYYCKDGSYKIINLKAINLISDPVIKGVLINYNDITEKKRESVKLKESENKYRTLFENMPDVVTIVDNKGKIIDVNPRGIKTFEYPKEELCQMNIGDLVYEEDKEKSQTFLNKLLTEGSYEDYEGRIITKSGKIKWIQVSSTVILQNGERIGSQDIIRDITEKKRVEKALVESEQKFLSAFEHASIGVALLSPDGNWLKVNQATCSIFGYTEEELLTITFQDITHPDDLEQDLELKGKLLTGEIQTYNLEKRYIHHNGNIVWGLLSVSLVRSSDNNPEFFISQIVDITKRKLHEKELEANRALLLEMNNTKDKFFSIIAHDLKGPFTAIIGYSDLLLERYLDYDQKKIHLMLQTISNSSKNTLELLENLLVWAHSQTGKIKFQPVKFDIQTLVLKNYNILKGNAEDKNITITSTIPDKSIVFGDTNMINTILRNLISNAIKFTAKNGRISIDLTCQDNQHLISVKDTGVGIPEENIPLLFKIESNVSTKGTEKEKGSGLGLILCKEFVEKHGGKIWVESEINEGSTFYFTLPQHY